MTVARRYTLDEIDAMREVLFDWYGRGWPNASNSMVITHDQAMHAERVERVLRTVMLANIDPNEVATHYRFVKAGCGKVE